MPELLGVLAAALAGAGVGLVIDRLAAALPDEPPRFDAVWQQRRRVLLTLGLAVSYGYLAWRFGLTPRFPVALFYAALFFLISAIDLEHRLVLNKVIYPAILLAPVAGVIWGLHPVAVVFGGIIEFGLFLVSSWFFKDAIGGGDVKLGAFLGMIAGYPAVTTAILYTGLFSGIVSGGLLLLGKKGRKDYIPFAPFLVWGTAAALLLTG